MRLPLWLREVGHAFIWFLPVPVSVYVCDSLHVSVAWAGVVRWAVFIGWTIITLLCEIMELADGKQDRRKYMLDKVVKIAANILGMAVAGFWRELK